MKAVQCLCLLLAALMLSLGAQAEEPETDVLKSDALTSDVLKRTTELPLSELRALAEVLERVRAAYVEEIDDASLLESAIRGMLHELDPHTDYLTPDAFEDLQVTTTGEFGGLGIEVTMEEGFVKIVAPMDDTPASKADLRAGDMIMKIDGTFVKGMTLNEAVKLLRGEIGEDVTLSILRDDNAQPKEVTLTRDRIQIQSVRAEMIEPGFGYVRISQFQNNTGRDVAEQLKRLSMEEPLKGLVLDLRNNPGGVLGGAVQVADLLLNEGLIVYTKGRDMSAQLRYSATPGDRLESRPVVVLVNEGSASASEIVAGALQDHGRAIIVGRRTFGKGSVQSVLPLQDNRALKLTTARYYTPNDRSIQAEGIEPDIIVDIAHIELAQPRRGVREADLPRRLENGEAKQEKSSPQADQQEESDKPPLAMRDYALYQAVSILKGIDLLQTRARQ